MHYSSFQYPQKHGPTPTPYHDWDYVIFSQRWPVTACSQWEDANKINTCQMPPDLDMWTVHGIWPTKIGTEGPLYCPSSVHFDPDQLTSIMEDLKAYWTNVEANTKANSFWKHEWDKHGTCAVILPELNSVTNYFKKGLEWNKVYMLNEILANSKVVPGATGYTVEQIYDAIKAHTNVNPMIQCVTDQHTKESLISEIRICFNKSLELIDCDQTSPINRRSTGIITNCSLKKTVMYFAEVPTKQISYQMDYVDEYFKKHFEEQMYYMKMYRFLKFIIWFTT